MFDTVLGCSWDCAATYFEMLKMSTLQSFDFFNNKLNTKTQALTTSFFLGVQEHLHNKNELCDLTQMTINP
jgi:hypothetical protein